MSSRNSSADARRFCQVLHGIAFPAATWQLIMYAEEYGADAGTRRELWAIPDGVYLDMLSVLAALGLKAPRALITTHGLEAPLAGAAQP